MLVLQGVTCKIHRDKIFSQQCRHSSVGRDAIATSCYKCIASDNKALSRGSKRDKCHTTNFGKFPCSPGTAGTTQIRSAALIRVLAAGRPLRVTGALANFQNKHIGNIGRQLDVFVRRAASNRSVAVRNPSAERLISGLSVNWLNVGFMVFVVVSMCVRIYRLYVD